MVEALVSFVLENVTKLVVNQVKIYLDFPDELNSMKDSLASLQSFLKDIDKKKSSSDFIRHIILELREFMYMADDILADCSFWSVSSNLAKKKYYQHRISKNLKHINQSIKDFLVRVTALLSPALTIQNMEDELAKDQKRWRNIPLLDETQIVGLEGAVTKIKSWILTEAHTELTHVGFVGMGGLGKTTLAEKIFKDREVIEHFERKMFVLVSQPVNVEKILQSILKNLGDVNTNNCDLREMSENIKRYLDGRRYFIVLDDVWSLEEHDWWDTLQKCLPKENNGSCLVITSREVEVVKKMRVPDNRIHKPDFLTDEEGWTLFSKIVFAGRNDHDHNHNLLSENRDLKDIGIEIVRKCSGLPLAIKAIAGCVSPKTISPAEWRHITDTFTDLLSDNKDITKASLLLSYDNLPTYLKPCLLCFSVFPEDCTILPDELIRWWIGEGFVPLTKKGELSVESAEDCFTGLVNRCLIEVVERDYNGKVRTCRMHDLVRDMVIDTGKSEVFCDVNNNMSRRIAVNDDSIPNEMSMTNVKLRAVVSVTNCRYVGKMKATFLKNICGSKYLKVLDLSESISETHFKDMLSKVDTTLRHLTYLNLRNTHPMFEVPAAICNLRRLLVLDLSFCQHLETLPGSITSMKELVLLDVSVCGSLKYLPKGLGNVSTLQVVKGFKPSRPCFYTEGCKFEELRRLTELVTLEMVVDRDDQISNDEVDALSNLNKLHLLSISCFNSHGSANIARKLDSLRLPQKLVEINLKYYPGFTTPSWLNPDSLPQLKYLSLCSVDFEHFHENFYKGKQWGITNMMFDLLPDFDEDWQKVRTALPFLVRLIASWCSKLETFPIENIDFEGGEWRRS